MYYIETVMDGVTQVWSTRGWDFAATLLAHGYDIVSVVVG